MAHKRSISARVENLVRAVKRSTGSNPGVLDRVGRAKVVRKSKATFKAKAKSLYSGYKKDMASYYSHKNTHGY
jgi:hypothetical protein